MQMGSNDAPRKYVLNIESHTISISTICFDKVMICEADEAKQLELALLEHEAQSLSRRRIGCWISASCDIRAAPIRVQRSAGNTKRETIPRADLYCLL